MNKRARHTDDDCTDDDEECLWLATQPPPPPLSSPSSSGRLFAKKKTRKNEYTTTTTTSIVKTLHDPQANEATFLILEALHSSSYFSSSSSSLHPLLSLSSSTPSSSWLTLFREGLRLQVGASVLEVWLQHIVPYADACQGDVMEEEKEEEEAKEGGGGGGVGSIRLETSTSTTIEKKKEYTCLLLEFVSVFYTPFKKSESMKRIMKSLWRAVFFRPPPPVYLQPHHLNVVVRAYTDIPWTLGHNSRTVCRRTFDTCEERGTSIIPNYDMSRTTTRLMISSILSPAYLTCTAVAF